MKKLPRKTQNHPRRTRPTHKKILLHPVSFFIMLCTGVLLAYATVQANADTLDISATVPAPPLTEPAVITSPTEGHRTSDPHIAVSGTCPAESYVKVFNNTAFIGVSQCVGGEFSVQALLTNGANTLQAKVFNITNAEGPGSPSITVYYDPPLPSPPTEQLTLPQTPPTQTPEAQPPSATPPPSGSLPGLSVTSPYTYRTLYVNEVWKWEVTISGGKAPYTLTINWGDGTTQTLEASAETTRTISHTYKKSGTFRPLITVTDSSGQTAIHQTMAAVKPLPSFSLAPLTPVDDIKNYLWIIWPAYIVITLMIFSFWLGEFEVLQHLAGRTKGKPLRK